MNEPGWDGYFKCCLCNNFVREVIQPVDNHRLFCADPPRCRGCQAKLDAGTHILIYTLGGPTRLVQIRV